MEGQDAERSRHAPRAQRLRVLVLTAYPALGGPLPKITPLLVRGLQDSGCDVSIVGWSAHRRGHESLSHKVAGRVGDMCNVLRWALLYRPGVAYVATSHGWPSLARDIPLAVMLRTIGLPFVLHLHGSEADRLGIPGQRLFTAASVWLARRAGAVLLLSSEEVGPWHWVCPEVRLEVVVNPFVPANRETAAGSSASGGDQTLLLVARLERGKGVFDVLDALEIVRRRRRCRLVYAGSGPAREELARRVDARGLADAVDFLGYVSGSALDEAYRRADVFVLPSFRKEGFPVSVMEAMGYGLPVITTRRRGCADLLEPDKHALFVPASDPAALASAILRLLEDGDLRERMGEENLKRVAEFSPDHVVPRYAEILRLVAERRRPRVGMAPAGP